MAMSLQNALLTQNSDDSDSEDDDYVPSGAEESDEEIEDVVGEDDDPTEEPSGKRKKKSKPQKNVKSRKRKGGITLSDDDEVSREAEDEEKPASPEPDTLPKDDKKKSDSLWADFLSDVTPPPKKKTSLGSCASLSAPLSSSLASVTKPVSKPEKVTITEIFEFAGESVEVKKEVDSNSKAAKDFVEEQQKKNQSQSSTSSAPKPGEPLRVKKPDGLNAVLGKVLGKKSKLSTLEKSKLDWNTFKREEGVEEDLDQYKRSKNGYLERQAFLQRADLRQFEIEKGLRDINRNHRV